MITSISFVMHFYSNSVSSLTKKKHENLEGIVPVFLLISRKGMKFEGTDY